MSIKAITFDFWATLYTSNPVDRHRRLRELQQMVEQRAGVSLTMEAVQAAVRVARKTWTRVWMEEYRTLTTDEWLEIMLAELHLPLPAADRGEIQHRLATSVYEDLPTLVPDAAEALPQLARTYRLAVISDTGLTPGWVLRELMARDGILPYFDHLTFSDELGRSKPHPDAFLSTLRALGVEPAEAVHVGDLLRTDIAGAKGVGMRGVQYTGVNQEEWVAAADTPAQGVNPDAVIRRHTELARLLRQWENGD